MFLLPNTIQSIIFTDWLLLKNIIKFKIALTSKKYQSELQNILNKSKITKLQLNNNNLINKCYKFIFLNLRYSVLYINYDLLNNKNIINNIISQAQFIKELNNINNSGLEYRQIKLIIIYLSSLEIIKFTNINDDVYLNDISKYCKYLKSLMLFNLTINLNIQNIYFEYLIDLYLVSININNDINQLIQKSTLLQNININYCNLITIIDIKFHKNIKHINLKYCNNISIVNLNNSSNLISIEFDNIGILQLNLLFCSKIQIIKLTSCHVLNQIELNSFDIHKICYYNFLNCTPNYKTYDNYNLNNKLLIIKCQNCIFGNHIINKIQQNCKKISEFDINIDCNDTTLINQIINQIIYNYEQHIFILNIKLNILTNNNQFNYLINTQFVSDKFLYCCKYIIEFSINIMLSNYALEQFLINCKRLENISLTYIPISQNILKILLDYNNLKLVTLSNINFETHYFDEYKISDNLNKFDMYISNSTLNENQIQFLIIQKQIKLLDLNKVNINNPLLFNNENKYTHLSSPITIFTEIRISQAALYNLLNYSNLNNLTIYSINIINEFVIIYDKTVTETLIKKINENNKIINWK